mmetsp:Transcript_28466/g.65998  ORF Transcript_28466/g.65998 Transcript_28466/m.65998 type:complete len:248 (-) Transcript_28466:1050-1793(-)
MSRAKLVEPQTQLALVRHDLARIRPSPHLQFLLVDTRSGIDAEAMGSLRAPLLREVGQHLSTFLRLPTCSLCPLWACQGGCGGNPTELGHLFPAARLWRLGTCLPGVRQIKGHGCFVSLPTIILDPRSVRQLDQPLTTQGPQGFRKPGGQHALEDVGVALGGSESFGVQTAPVCELHLLPISSIRLVTVQLGHVHHGGPSPRQTSNRLPHFVGSRSHRCVELLVGLGLSSPANTHQAWKQRHPRLRL